MTAPVWPVSFPQQVEVDSYQETAPEGAVRTDMDSGQPKVRPRFTKVPHIFQMAVAPLTATNVTDLDTFYETTCAMGTIDFTWVHPRTAAAATFRWMKRHTVVPADNSPISFIASLQLMIIP